MAGVFAAQVANNCAKARGACRNMGAGIDQDAGERKDNSQTKIEKLF